MERGLLIESRHFFVPPAFFVVVNFVVISVCCDQAREEVSAAQGREAEAAQKKIELEKQLEVGLI